MKRTLCALFAILLLLLCLPIGITAEEQNETFPMYPASRLAGMQTTYLAPDAETPGKSLNAGATFTMVGTYGTDDGKTGGLTSGSGTVEDLTDGIYGKAIKWYFSPTVFYNIAGESAEKADATHLYKTVLVADLGSVKELTALSIVVCQNTIKIASALQAGDIYISKDGESWTLATGWDIVKYRQDNVASSDKSGDLAAKALLRTITDSNNNTHSEYRIALSGEARYVRIGLTAGAGKSNANQTYEKALNTVDKLITIYGISLWGYDTTTDVAVTDVQDTRAAGGETYDVRFLAQVKFPSTAQKYGFELTVAFTDATGSRTATKRYESDTVYTSILANGNRTAAPDGWSWGMLTLTDVPSDLTVTFTVRPYLILEDGSIAWGEPVTNVSAPDAQKGLVES